MPDANGVAAPEQKWHRLHLVLVLPFAALLWPALYVRDKPRLAGVPFFYWYQFAWVALTSLLVWVVVRPTDVPPEEQP